VLFGSEDEDVGRHCATRGEAKGLAEGEKAKQDYVFLH
jgi:hypothetical protein